MALTTVGRRIAQQRRSQRLSQSALAQRAQVSRPTLDRLENGRLRELGYTKLARILAALGMELELRAAETRRPTLEQLRDEWREEKERDQDLDRRS